MVAETHLVPTVDIATLFRLAGLTIAGEVAWGEAVPYRGPGVYAICAPEAGQYQPLVYVGRAVNVGRRLRQFYRHTYGRSSPHRGGQDILPLPGPKTVTWAEAEDYTVVEHRLLEIFSEVADQLPHGNRIRASVAVRN